jgi:hypothetical protein
MGDVVTNSLVPLDDGDITGCIKSVLKDIKILDDDTQQNKAIEQIKTDLFALTSDVYKLATDEYNSQKPTFDGYDIKDFFVDVELLKFKGNAKIQCTNKAWDYVLPFAAMLNFFGKELVLEFGKNELVTSINIQCHETALKILKELHNKTLSISTMWFKFDESGFVSILQQYTNELEKIKPSSEIPKTPVEQSPLFTDLEIKDSEFSFLTKPLIRDTGCGCFSFTTTPLFIVGILAFAIIIAILPSNESQKQNASSKSTSASNIEDQKLKARVQLEQSIKANLREPKSYQNTATDVYTIEEYIFV